MAAQTNAVTASRVAFDQVECAVRAGHRQRARDVASCFESWVRQTGVAWVGARVATCQALVSAGSEVTEAFAQALALDGVDRPFDSARIHLLFGEHLRQERLRVDARHHLRAAISGFEQLQADPWAERARFELRAIGETARRRGPSAVDQLTSQELRTSQFVVAGVLQQADRCTSVPVTTHDRRPSAQCLRQARHQLALQIDHTLRSTTEGTPRLT